MNDKTLRQVIILLDKFVFKIYFSKRIRKCQNTIALAAYWYLFNLIKHTCMTGTVYMQIVLQLT